MLKFKIAGPIEIPFRAKGKAKIIDPSIAERIWEKSKFFKDRVGCYVFAIRAGGGFTPFYVGQTTRRTFEKECLANRNISKFYNPVLMDYDKGTPVLFLIYPKDRKGPVPAANISNVEKFLTELALLENEGLCNTQNTKKKRWGIAGITRGYGKGSQSSSKFKKLMGLV